MKYYGGCDVGSTYTKAVILDENGKIVRTPRSRAKSTPRSRPSWPWTKS